MSNNQTKENNSKISSSKKKSKTPLSTRKLVTNKKELTNKIEKIGDFVSNELDRYDEGNLDLNNILYLKSEQLFSKELEKDLEKFPINLNELRTIIREIVIEEIEKNKPK